MDNVNHVGYDTIGYRDHKYAILSIQIWIRYRMLNIRTRMLTDLNPSKWIRSRMRSKNIRTVFTLSYSSQVFHAASVNNFLK
jgi:hypothetical protein